PRPTDTALKGRARALLAAMTERTRWIYAVPRDETKQVQPILETADLVCEERAQAAGIARFSEPSKISFVVFDNPELEMMLIETAGEDAPPILAQVLDKTGFYAQSQLIDTALNVHDPETNKTLRTLAHMVVG